MFEVIMYFVVYLSIQPDITLNADSSFAIYFVSWVSHVHLVQAFVLKPLKAEIENRLTI